MKIQTILALTAAAAAAGAYAVLKSRAARTGRKMEQTPDPASSPDAGLERRMKEFLDDDRFSLFIQPVVELSTGRMIGGEVLSRLNHPERGLILPDTFLKVINRMELQADFDLYIFRKSCAWLSKAEGIENISVNFSRKTLSLPRIAEQLAGIADAYHLDHTHLAIEITEWEKEDDIQVYRENISQLREQGFKIFLDDFGSGVTSIADLNQCSMDIVKIDRSVLLAAQSPDGSVILQTLIEMAGNLGVDVVCEGIETQEQEQLARSCGCRYAQGLRYYAPVHTDELQRDSFC